MPSVSSGWQSLKMLVINERLFVSIKRFALEMMFTQKLE